VSYIKHAAWLIPAVVALAVPAYGQRSALLKEFESAFVDLSAEVRPSVVEISAQGPITDEDREQLNDLFRFFNQPDGGEEDGGGDETHPQIPERRPRSTASGFIVDELGHVVTNNHVVKGADSIEVQLWDGTTLPAEVIGQDPDADIAVVKFDPAGLELRPVKLGNSSGLKVGQFAIAMGSPSGLTGSFSYGHVTGLGRESLDLPDQELRFQEFIQTDAAINLGNSGGPLCNIDGEVIGINVAIVYRANSIGFAIPVDRVKNIVPQLIANGKVIRGWLGVSVQDISVVALEDNQEVHDFVEAHNLPDIHGSYIVRLTPNGPAERGLLEAEDVVRRINETDIVRSTDLINTISAIDPGETAQIQFWRRGKPMQLSVIVGEFPGRMTAIYGPDYLGMHISELQLNPDFMEKAGMKEPPSDFFVVDVVPDSPAQEAGIRRGDVVVEVAYQTIKTKAEFLKVLGEEAQSGKTLLMKVWTLSDKEPRKVYVKVPDKFTLN
jgi:serine protease Do